MAGEPRPATSPVARAEVWHSAPGRPGVGFAGFGPSPRCADIRKTGFVNNAGIAGFGPGQPQALRRAGCCPPDAERPASEPPAPAPPSSPTRACSARTPRRSSPARMPWRRDYTTGSMAEVAAAAPLTPDSNGESNRTTLAIDGSAESVNCRLAGRDTVIEPIRTSRSGSSDRFTR